MEILLEDNGAKRDKILMVTGERENNKTNNKENTGHADINHRIGFINSIQGKGKLDGDLDTKGGDKIPCVHRTDELSGY